MSKYTTGEIAKLCGVTVRTVQYYDSRNILVPSELSEGGRRLYSEEDLRRLKIICFLRETGLSIDGIKQLLSEEHPETVISVLLEEQKKSLEAEVSEAKERLRTLEGIQTELKDISNFTVDSIGDIAHMMKNKEKRRKMLRNMVIAGVISEVIQMITIVIGIKTGMWWPLVAELILEVCFAVGLSRYYFKYTAYICPECHETFRTSFKEVFWAKHTPKLRKVTCPNCGRKGFCVEIYQED